MLQYVQVFLGGGNQSMSPPPRAVLYSEHNPHATCHPCHHVETGQQIDAGIFEVPRWIILGKPPGMNDDDLCPNLGGEPDRFKCLLDGCLSDQGVQAGYVDIVNGTMNDGPQ